MPKPLRIDQVRDAERQLHKAFERGTFDAGIREVVRAAELLGVPLPERFEELLKPGTIRNRFCYRTALGWSEFLTPDQRASGIVAHALLVFRQMWELAPAPVPQPAVLRLAPAPVPQPVVRARSILARLLPEKD